MTAKETDPLRDQLARCRRLLEECVFVIEGHQQDYHFRTPPDFIDRLKEAIVELGKAPEAR